MTDDNKWARYAAAKAAVGPVHKNRDNSYFNSRYADLGTIKRAVDEAFLAHGLVVVERVSREGGDQPTLVTDVRDCAGQEGVVTSTIPIISKDPSNPQAQGSGLTYARRQNYCVIGGVAPDDDDDGNTAARSKPAANDREKPPGDGRKAHARNLYKILAEHTSTDLAKSVVADCMTDDERIAALEKALEGANHG